MSGMGGDNHIAARTMYAQDDISMTDAGPSTAPLAGIAPGGPSTWFRED